MHIKRLGLILTLSLLLSGPAIAAHHGKVVIHGQGAESCSSVTAKDPLTIWTSVEWVTGYLAGRNQIETGTVDLLTLDPDDERDDMLAYCSKNPNKLLIDFAESLAKSAPEKSEAPTDSQLGNTGKVRQSFRDLER